MLFSPSAYTFQFPLMAALVTALYLFTKDQIASETREAKAAPRMPVRQVPTPLPQGVR
jgi:hypothetical protein